MKKKVKDNQIYTSLIIGLGKIGMYYDLRLDHNKYIYTHSSANSLHPKFNLLGGVDPNTDARKVFTEKYHVKSFKSISAALSEVKPEIVIVSTSSISHLKIIRQVIKKHKPRAILCEKPMGNDLSQAEKIVKVCKENNIRLFVNYVRNCLPGNVTIKSNIQKKIIKSPFKSVIWYSKGLKNNGSHFINLMEDWFGNCIDLKIIYKSAETSLLEIEPTVYIKFEKCDVLLISALEEFYSHYTIELISASGRLYWNKFNIRWSEIAEDGPLEGEKRLSAQSEDILTGIEKYQLHVLDQLYFALQGETSFICSGEKALATHITIDRIERMNKYE